jgi:hypothetical protein
MDAYREFLARIGTYFQVVGAFLFILFVTSDLAKKADFDYLFLSVLSLAIGWMFRRNKPPATGSGRFAWWRSTRGRGNVTGTAQGKAVDHVQTHLSERSHYHIRPGWRHRLRGRLHPPDPVRRRT